MPYRTGAQRPEGGLAGWRIARTQPEGEGGWGEMAPACRHVHGGTGDVSGLERRKDGADETQTLSPGSRTQTAPVAYSWGLYERRESGGLQRAGSRDQGDDLRIARQIPGTPLLRLTDVFRGAH